MKFNYHPATGYQFHLSNGSEMYRENLRRLLNQSDIKSDKQDLQEGNEDELALVEEPGFIEETKSIEKNLLGMTNLNVSA